MTIKKFIGKTEAEATEEARKELGPNCVIMNVRTIKPTGLFSAFKSNTYEVTAAIEEKEPKIRFNGMEDTGKGGINLAAEETIDLKALYNEERKNLSESKVYKRMENRGADSTTSKPVSNVIKNGDVAMESHNINDFGEKLENLQSMLEKSLSAPKKAEEAGEAVDTPKNTSKTTYNKRDNNIDFIKMIYNTLLDNEVNERYINQLLEELDKSMQNITSIDVMLANIYQKMILKFGKPLPINLAGKKPKVIFFIGPTGVGKTTTIAKVASKLKVEEGRKISLFTADTYRIAAEEQLRTYANILSTPLTIIYAKEELKDALDKAMDSEVILVDTAGFSHKSVEQKRDTKELIESLPEDIEKEVYLVLSATTKYKDLVEIAEAYKEIASYKLIFTKLDETSSYGNLYNIRMYTGADMSYVTYGQNVPDDIGVFNTQSVVKKLLGGN